MITPEQSRAARAWLDWSQEQLAERANVSLSTIRDFEKGRRTPIRNNLEAIVQVLEEEGISLRSVGGIGVGIDSDARTSERALTLPVLDYLDESLTGFMTTSDLIEALELRFEPRGEDAEILKNRSDIKFSQIVRNIISHRRSPTNLIGGGYAAYDQERHGLTITDKGRAYLIERGHR